MGQSNLTFSVIQVESLQADNDFTKEQLTNIKTRMEAIKEKDGDNQYIPEFESTGSSRAVCLNTGFCS